MQELVEEAGAENSHEFGVLFGLDYLHEGVDSGLYRDLFEVVFDGVVGDNWQN